MAPVSLMKAGGLFTFVYRSGTVGGVTVGPVCLVSRDPQVLRGRVHHVSLGFIAIRKVNNHSTG